MQWDEVDGVIEAVSALVGDAGEGIGSNSWAVSGDLTESGMPLLANDPHLGAELPSVWHQVGLKCRTITALCPFDVSGFSFSGVPGVVIGHNERIAWGFTNLTTDVTDLYLEKIQDGQYWRDGALVPLEERTETLEVAGGDDVELTIRSTVNGPILSGLSDDFDAIAADPYTGTDGSVTAPAGAPEGDYAVSLKWTALQPGTTAAAIFALNVAQNFDDFRAAAQLFDVPAQNLLYADVDGNIGYQTPGLLPIRGAGDGSMPQPGWDSAYAWRGFIPFDELPTSFNPPEGYIVTANNAIVDESYPYFLTRDWDYGWRAARIVDLLQRKAAMGKLTADDLRDIQADNEFAMGKNLASAYMDISTGRQGPDAALDMLRAWDAQNSADSDAAAFANVLWDELVMDLFVNGREHAAPVTGQGRLFLVVDGLLDDPDSEWWTNEELNVDGQSEMLAHAASEAYDRLVALQGDNPAKWNWGSCTRCRWRTPRSERRASPRSRCSSTAVPIRSAAEGRSSMRPAGRSVGLRDDHGALDAHGGRSRPTSTRRAGTTSPVRADTPIHPNYVDQTQAWQRAELTPWAFTDEAVDAASTHTLVLVPADESR